MHDQPPSRLRGDPYPPPPDGGWVMEGEGGRVREGGREDEGEGFMVNLIHYNSTICDNSTIHYNSTIKGTKRAN